MGAGSRIQQQFHVIAPSGSGHTAVPFDGERRPDGALHGVAAQDVLDELEQDHDRALLHGAWSVVSGETSSFVNDVAAFDRAYIDGTTQPVGYLVADATGGLGSRETGRPFGVRIEFCVDDHGILVDIARELEVAGIVREAFVHGCREAREFGYTDHPDDWRLVRDETVTGVMSPMMYDEPVTWRNLRSVCETVVKHGGMVAPTTGGYIDIGLPEYDHVIGCYDSLLRDYLEYEDVLFRLAQNPDSDRQRGLRYCLPNTAPGEDFQGMSAVRNGNWVNALCLSSLRGFERDHARFSMYDGSLDPGTNQTRIKVSLGMAAAAAQSSDVEQRPDAREYHPLGHHLARFGAAGPGSAGWHDSTLVFRRMVDYVFRRPVDKRQTTALFARTAWQEAPGEEA